MSISKKATLLLLLVFITIPSTSSALSLDDTVKQWMDYAKAKIAALENENKELRAQLSSCSIDGKNETKDTKKVTTKTQSTTDEDLEVEVLNVRQTSYPDGYGGVYGSYEIELAVTAGSEKIYIPKTTNDSVGTGIIGFKYSIEGDTFKGEQDSQVSCSVTSKGYCSIAAGKTRTITATVWLTPSSQGDGNYAVSFDSLYYFIDGEKKTFQLEDIKTENINLYY